MGRAEAGRGRRGLACRQDSLYLSVLAFAEIRLGIALLPPGRRRAQLTAWLDRDLDDRFEGRILAIDRTISEAWAEIVARARVRGTPPPILDAFLAATALVHGMTVVTRNLRHLERLEVPVLDPWQG